MKIVHIDREKIRREQQVDLFQKDLREHLEKLARKRAWRKFNKSLLRTPK